MKLFNTALAEREYYFNIDGTNAFRLFNAEGDGVWGSTIDNYDGHLLIQWYSKRYLINLNMPFLKRLEKYLIINLFTKK